MKHARSKVIVVKIGSSTLVGEDGALDRGYLEALAEQVVSLRKAGWKPIIVSSAAIACGVQVLGLDARPTDMPSLQAAASVGQGALASAYSEVFGAHDVVTSLVLLTRHDTASRHAYVHARETLRALLEYDVVPVVNENDTTSVEEIRFGDNDTLAALVACLIKADMCVIFSDIDGLYTANPREDANARKLDRVDFITPEIMASAGGVGSSVGSGGMVTKIRAARVLMIAGIPLVVCNGHEPHALERLVQGESVGTCFEARRVPHEITNYKLWIALGDSAKGSIVVDDGARDALVGKGSSLLCVGVTNVTGTFDAGDIVNIEDARGHLFARGKVSASSDEILLARGYSQAQMAANRLLAPLAESPIVHRDELVVFE